MKTTRLFVVVMAVVVCVAGATVVVAQNTPVSDKDLDPGVEPADPISPDLGEWLSDRGGSRDVLLSEDFSTCPGGWTTTDPNSDGTWGCSTSTPYWTISPMGSVAGNFMLIDDDSNDGANSDEQLISPAFDCTGYTNVTLDFDGCFNSVFSGTPYPDSDYLNVQVFDGSTWHDVGSFPTFDDDIGFGDVGALNISSAAAGNANVQVRFVFNDYGSWAWGAVIDNVTVEGFVSRAGVPVLTTGGIAVMLLALAGLAVLILRRRA